MANIGTSREWDITKKDYESPIEDLIDKAFEKHISAPIESWANEKLDSVGDWIVTNGLEFITLAAIIIIATMGFKIFLQIIMMKKDRNDEKTIGTIYLTIVSFSILRLFWKVVLIV